MIEILLVHGNELSGPSGQIASPLYPKIFYDTLLPSISWRITVDFDSNIIITFKDFYVESYTSDECYIVSLEVTINKILCMNNGNKFLIFRFLMGMMRLLQK